MQPQHVDPAEAVQIHLDLNAKRSVGMHWGTFELTDESLDQPPIDLAAARQVRGLADAAFFGARDRRDTPVSARRATQRARSRATSSFIAASVDSPGARLRRPWLAGSAMWIALLTWLTGSTQK